MAATPMVKYPSLPPPPKELQLLATYPLYFDEANN
jgi:hypothetical protein